VEDFALPKVTFISQKVTKGNKVSNMFLELHSNSRRKRVLPIHVVDYAAFKDRFGLREGESELHSLEKFHAARSLVEEGYEEAYIDASIRSVPTQRPRNSIFADACGKRDGELTVVFCETVLPGEDTYADLEFVEKADNARAVLMYPFTINAEAFANRFPRAIESGKISIARVGWLNHGLESAFKEALDLLDLLSNETRVRMLMPLLESHREKRQYRAEINPKLVYENLRAFLESEIINEISDGQYELTNFGKHVLCEYLTFIERLRKIRRTMER